MIYTTDGELWAVPNPAWDDHTKLRWAAASIVHDTGLQVEVVPAAGEYELRVGTETIGPFKFNEADIFLRGVYTAASLPLIERTQSWG